MTPQLKYLTLYKMEKNWAYHDVWYDLAIKGVTMGTPVFLSYEASCIN